MSKLWLAAGLVTVVSVGCGSGDDTSSPDSGPSTMCEPGLRQECACDTGTGMQDCAADGSGWGQCLCPVTHVVYTPGTHAVDLAGDPDIEVDGTTLRIPRAGHDDIAALREGEILVHFGNPPLLRRILAKRMEGDTIVLETRVAALSEAFEDLTLHLEGAPVNMYGALPEATRASLEASRVGLSGGAGGLSFGASGMIHPSISFSEDSDVWFEPNVDVDLDWGAGGVRRFRFVTGLDAGFDFTTTVGLTGTGSISVELELIEAILINLVPPIRPPEINIYLGAGLFASPKIILGCELSVDGTVEVTSRVHAGFDVRGGVDYRRGRDGDDWRLVNERSVSGGAELLDTSASVGAQLTCYVRPRIELSFLEVVTAYAQVGPEAAARVEFGRTNSFGVDVGVRGTVGFSIGVDIGELEITFFERSYDLFNLSRNLYYQEFALCGDGYRQVVPGGTAEECDPGPFSDPECVDCRCAPLTIPVDFTPYVIPDSVYRWHGALNWCRPSCWNRVVDPGEVCDEGPSGTCPGSEMGCSADCLRRTGVCGDGTSECWEGCDDGNTVSCDGCSGDCFFTDNCGNGWTNWECGEQCDDANTDNFDGCTNNCRRPFCGNGELEGTEECDDGNSDNCDACHNDCRNNENRCGDYYVCGAEECDHGATVEFWDCNPDCTDRRCGDGYRHTMYEACDDGNTDDCDACHDDCTLNERRCGDGHVCDAEECDDSGADTYGCDADCTTPVCGDGHFNPLVERCDDGDTDSCTTACNAFCNGPAPAPRCGNNYTECGEVCDDGPFNGFCGYCAAGCAGTFGVCGDGVIDVPCGEVCDDNNAISGDGCRGDCRGTERCGDGLVDTGELCDDGLPAVCVGTCNSTCTALLTGTCGDGTVTGPCEVCEDTVPANTSPDLGCGGPEPHCNSCQRCSADVCGDGVRGPSEGCELSRQCQPSENVCSTLADCLMTDYACTPVYGEGLCDPTCTRLQICGDSHVDGYESCDDGNTIDEGVCNSTCSGTI